MSKTNCKARPKKKKTESEPGQAGDPYAGVKPDDLPDDQLVRRLVKAIRQDVQRNWRLLPPQMARDIFRNDVAGGVLKDAAPVVVSEGGETDDAMTLAYAISHISDTLKRMKASDPVEEMLITQMVLAHARVLRLTKMSNQSSSKVLTAVAEACDSASNTYRRLMLALVEYRNPRRTATTINAVRQLNVADQQVVQQQNAGPAPAEAAAGPESKSQNEETSNKEGSAEAPAPLLSVASGTEFVAEFGPAREAVAVGDRARDGQGQGPVAHERLEARASVGRVHAGTGGGRTGAAVFSGRVP